MAERTIQLKLTIDPSGAITAINDVVVEGKKAANALESPFAAVAARGFGIKALVSGLSATFGDWIRVSNEGEAAVAKLQQAIAGAGGNIEAETAQIRSYASARQEATGVDDDATVAIAAQLRAMNLQGEQLKLAIARTQDLATLMDGDMNGAVRVIADAFNGNTGMLKRYVKGLDEADIKQRGTISIIEQLTKAVGGQAEAVGNTGAGQIKKFTATIDDLKQAFGDLIKGALSPVISFLTQLIRFLVDAPKPLQVVTLGVTALAGAFTLLGTSMGGLPFLIGGVVTAITSLVVFLKDVKEKNQQMGDASLTAASKVEVLRNRIDELKKSAGETKELEALLKKLDELRNPVTEAKLLTEVEQAREEAEQLSARYQETVEVANRVRELEQQGVDVRSKNPELAQRYIELLGQGGATEEAIIADLEKRTGEALERQKLKEAELEVFREEARKKASEKLQSNLDKEVAANLERGKKIIELEKLTALVAIENDEKIALSHAKAEDEKAAVTRNAALQRIDAEERAALAIIELEERLLKVRRESATPEERTNIDRRLQTLTTEREVVTRTAVTRRETVEVDFKISKEGLALPGTIRELEEQIRRDREALQNATSDSERAALRERIARNQAALDAMSKSEEELLADQQRINEERRRLWAEHHQVATAAINAIGAGVRAAWDEMVVVHRQGKDTADKIWLAIENTALTAIGNILARQIEAYLIDTAAHSASEATKTATTETHAGARLVTTIAEGVGKAAAWAAELVAFVAKETAMTASFLAQQAIRVAATVAGAIVEIGATIAKAVANAIAALGPFGLFAAPGLIAAGVAVVKGIRSAFGFARGGILEKDQRGFIEGGQVEIIAPRRTFEEIMRTEIIPMIVRTTQIVTLNAPQPVFAGAYDFNRLEQEIRGLRADVRRKNYVTNVAIDLEDGVKVVQNNLRRAERNLRLTEK